MRDGSRVAVAVLVAVAALAGVVAPATADSDADRQPGLDGTALADQSREGAVAFAQSQVDPDVVVMRADVGADGDAAWTVELRVRLEDENATAAFESVQADLAANETAFTSGFATGMERTVASAENATGREMRLENVTATSAIEQYGQKYGVLTYRFTWRSFAAVDGDRLRIGDSLSGFFLDSESSLVLAWPDDYARQAVTPDPDESGDGSVTWHGRATFGPEEPRVVAAPAGGSSLPTALLAGAAVVVLAAAGGGWLVLSRRRGDDETPSASATGTAGDEAASASAATAAGAAGSAEEGDGDDDTAADDEGREEPPEELLSNEERVLKLLEDNGGRVKQQRIAEEYDWTDAKTSQVVGDLRDAGDVETFRIGRENVVTLPEESDL